MFGLTDHATNPVLHYTMGKDFCPVVWHSEVEKILKGSLDLISSPSPSVKIQIMGSKVCLRHKGQKQNIVYKLLNTKQHPVMFCLYTFLVYNLNFHWRWRDRIQAIYLNLFYFKGRNSYNIRSYSVRNDDFINIFWNLLTFS